jgi:hypothetical protein
MVTKVCLFKGSKLNKRDELANIEQILAKSLKASNDYSVISQQLIDILNNIARSKLSNVDPDYSFTTKDVLLVTMYVYSLIGNTITLIPEYETLLKDSFLNTMKTVFIIVIVVFEER